MLQKKLIKVFSYAFGLLLISILFQFCSVQKRKYNRGFYVSHKHHNHAEKINKSENELICSAKPEIVFIQNKFISENANSLITKNIPAVKTNFNKPKQFSNKIIKILLPHKKNLKISNPDKPNKASKYKVSIYQINVMGLVSVCLIPVMIIAFFIPGAAFLVWGAIIAGVLLALLCAFMIQKRPGAWMAGLAMGLWGLILLYFVLLLFVF